MANFSFFHSKVKVFLLIVWLSNIVLLRSSNVVISSSVFFTSPLLLVIISMVSLHRFVKQFVHNIFHFHSALARRLSAAFCGDLFTFCFCLALVRRFPVTLSGDSLAIFFHFRSASVRHLSVTSPDDLFAKNGLQSPTQCGKSSCMHDSHGQSPLQSHAGHVPWVSAEVIAEARAASHELFVWWPPYLDSPGWTDRKTEG